MILIQQSPALMRLRRIFLWPLLAAALPLGAQNNPPVPKSLSLADCIQIALEHNLDLKVERINPEMARYNVTLAYAGYDPVLDITANHQNSLSPGGLDPQNRVFLGSKTELDTFNTSLAGVLPTGLQYTLGGQIGDRLSNPQDPLRASENTSGSASLSLRQPLLKNFWIDGARFNIAVSKNRLKYSELGLRQRIMSVIESVQLAYYSLIQAREDVNNQEKALQLAERLLTENKKRVEVGALAPLDEKQAESQVAQRRADLLSAQSNLDIQQNSLKSLLSDNYTDWHGVPVEPSEALAAPPQAFDIQSSWQRGMTQRPDLLQTRLDLERLGLTLRYQRNQLFPQLDITGSYGHSGSKREYAGAFNDISEGNSPFYSIGGELRIPLGNRAARNNYKISKAQRDQLLLGLKKQEQDIMIAIDDAVKTARTAYQSVDATHQARLYAEAALDAEQKKLENGKSTSFVVLQLQRDLTFARSAEIRALGDYNKALARLAFTEGTTLEKTGLKIDVK